MRVIRRRLAPDPLRHRRASGERFPAAMKSAQARGTGSINHVMSQLGVGIVDATVESSIENDSAADSCANRDINQTTLVFTRSPSGFAKSGSVRVVLHSDLDAEQPSQISHDVASLPAWKKINVTNFSSKGIDRTRAANADSANLHSRFLQDLSQQIGGAIQRPRISQFCAGWGLAARQHATVIVYDADSDLRSPDVNRSNHRPLQSKSEAALQPRYSVHSTTAPSYGLISIFHSLPLS